MADKEATKTAAELKAADEAAKKIAASPEAAQAVTKAAAAAPHPTEDKPEPSTKADIIEARGRATEPLEDVDLDAPTNIGAPVGKPIKSIVRKKFYSEEGRIEVPGNLYYLQLREGQHYPSDVLEPVDKNLAAKYRREFKAWKDDRAEKRAAKRRAVESVLAAAGEAS